jgi:hypothetical protein
VKRHGNGKRLADRVHGRNYTGDSDGGKSNYSMWKTFQIPLTEQLIRL